MFRPGEVIDDRYRVVREIGKGGYGTVFLADELGSADLFDVGSDERVVLRQVAVKVLDGARIERRRFAAEVRALCRLNHPAIVTVHNFGETGLAPGGGSAAAATAPYVVMEMVGGASLGERLGEPARSAYARTIGQLIHIAAALGHAHVRGVIHRDLKPDNILVTDAEMPKVVDFGLSWLIRPDGDASQRVGTPGFLAPELLTEEDELRDHRADIYSFGATIFALFAGASPFQSGGVFATVKRQLASDWAFPDDFPQPLRQLVARCLERDPINRPRTAELVADELRRIALAGGAVIVGERRTSELSNLDELPARVDVRDASVRSVEPFEHATRGAGVKFEIVTGSGAGAEATGVFSYVSSSGSPSQRVTEVLTSAWDGAEISLFGLRPIADTGGRRFLAADGATVPVLSPYFPVTVTDVATAEGVRCASCATRVLVELRRARTPGRPLVVGSLAHDMLERIVRGRTDVSVDGAFERAFDQAIGPLRIDLLAAGLGDSDLGDLRRELRGHFDFFADWVLHDDGAKGGRFAEVRRFSGRYGLEGRIDLAVSEGKRLRIVELKTGRSERPEHVRQLRAYTLMWDAIAEQHGREVSGTLMYSQIGRLKPVHRREHRLEREVVVARNDVVALHRWFSDGDTSYRPPSYGEFPERCADAPCQYRRKECERQSRLLGTISGEGAVDAPIDRGLAGGADAELIRAARDWYHHFVRLVEREYRSASLAMGAIFRESTIGDRVARCSAVRDATLIRVDEDAAEVEFACDAWGIFDVGDRVVAHRGDFDAEPALTGSVRTRTAGGLVVGCSATDFGAELPRAGWVIDADVARIGFRAMHRALYGLISSGDPRRLERIVMPQRRSLGDQRELAVSGPTPRSFEAGGGRTELNADQQRAISEGLRSHDAFLIHGPPGTGKTTVIAELVRRLVGDGQRVLVAACTHTAVNNALAKVVRAGVADVIRVGSHRRTSSELDEALAAAGREPEAHFSTEMSVAARTLDQLRYRIEATPVVAATTNACASHPLFDVLRSRARSDRTGLPFDVAVIDEASQLTEPMALAAVNLAHRFVLVGDDYQLPPVVTASDALSANVAVPARSTLEASGVGGLDRSLFERLRPFVPHVLLTVQYRMNEGVQRFPNQAFYGDRLEAAPGAADGVLRLSETYLAGLDDELRRRLGPDRASVWVATEGGGGRHVQAPEVAEVVATAAALAVGLAVDGELRSDAVGVVAPFRAQCHAIRAGLREALPDLHDRIEVDTVERFQGREKDAMLVSLVAREWSDFVMDRRRLNVTLTRARTKVIVFGPRELGRRMVESLAAGRRREPVRE